MRLLLDTNAYAALFFEVTTGSPIASGVRSKFSLRRSWPVSCCSASVTAPGTKQNAGRLDDFLASPGVSLLPVTRVTADRFDRHFAEVEGIAWLHPEGSE